MDWAIILGVTLFAALLSLFLWFEANRQHIKKNWVTYRCQPYIMPFAFLFGKDTSSNFSYCMAHSFNGYAGYLFEPIYYMFSVIGSIIGDLVKSIDDIRTMLTSVRGGFLGIVGNVIGKIENLISEMTILIVRMRDIMTRLVGTLTVLGGVTMTTAATGSSLMNGPIGQVIDYFCFAKGTLVNTLDGPKPIEALNLGDMLTKDREVVSTMKFSGEGQSMYLLDGIKVSGNHLVLLDDQWVPVRDHPASTPTTPEPVLYCLNTSDNIIAIANHIFRDFEEVSNEDLTRHIQELIADEQGADHNVFVTGSYETGVCPYTSIAMASGESKYIAKMQLGDVLADGGIVTGIIRHQAFVDDFVNYEALVVLRDTAFVHPHKIRPSSADYVGDYQSCAMHLTTTTGRIPLASGHVILDDQESYDATVNAKRDALIKEYLRRSSTK